MADFIITIRPEPDASRDVEWLSRYQVPAIAFPVMRAEQQSFELPGTPPFQAIIFTSRHAVAAIARIDGITSIDKMTTLAALRSLPVYAVGRRTALAARQAGFDHVITGPGDGNALVPLMVASLNPNAGDILWPSANIISFDIASRLADLGYSVRQIPVYAMVAKGIFTVIYQPGLRPVHLRQWWPCQLGQWICFHRCSTAASLQGVANALW